MDESNNGNNDSHLKKIRRESNTMTDSFTPEWEPFSDEIQRDQRIAYDRMRENCPVEIGGHKIDSGQMISINWIAANRDGRVFNEPEAFYPDRNQDKNLLFGAGIHACPAEPLARMELRIVLEELLDKTTTISLSSDRPPVIARYPASGYEQLFLRIK